MRSVVAGRDRRSDAAGAPQTFRSPTAIIIWWVWLLFAAANLIDLAVQGRDHGSVIAAAIVILVTGVAYVTAQRPRIIADQAGVTVVNPLRDHHAGWAQVAEVDPADLLRVRFRQDPERTKVIYAWAIHYSRRRKLMTQVKSRRQTARMTSGRPSFGLGGFASAPPAAQNSAAEADAERIAGVLMQYVTAVRDETTAADPRRAGWSQPLRSTWDRLAILAVVIPALILLVAGLV